MARIQLVDPNGEIYSVDEEEAEAAQQQHGLSPATPEQVQAYQQKQAPPAAEPPDAGAPDASVTEAPFKLPENPETPGRVQLVDPGTGELFSVDVAEAEQAQAIYGYKPASPDEIQQHLLQQRRGTSLVDKGKTFVETLQATGAELAEAASARGIGQTVDPNTGAIIGPANIDPLSGKARPGVVQKAEAIAPSAYTQEAKERRLANPNTAAAAVVAPDLLASLLIPGAGVGGLAASAIISGAITEAGASAIDGDEFSVRDMMLATGGAFALEGIGALAIPRALKALGGAPRNHVDVAIERSRKLGADDALDEVDPVKQGSKLRRNEDAVYERVQTELDEAINAIDTRIAEAPDAVFTPQALKRSVSANLGAQEDAFLDLAVRLDNAVQTADEVPGLQNARDALQNTLGKPGHEMFSALNTAKRELEAIGSDSPLVQDAIEALDASMRSERLWGKAAKTYADVADEGAAAVGSWNVREVAGREALDARLDRARARAVATGDKQLAKEVAKAEKALGRADKATGARLLGETTPDDVAKLRKQVEGFEKRGPKLAKELSRSLDKLKKRLGDGVIPSATEDDALDYIAARVHGIGGGRDPLKAVLKQAEQHLDAMKAKGADQIQIAKAQSEINTLREAVEEINDVPKAARRVREWESAPARLKDKAADEANAIVEEEIEHALQPVLQGGGAALGGVMFGVPGYVGGYLLGRHANKKLGSKIAKYMWGKSKRHVAAEAVKSPGQAAAGVVGAGLAAVIGGPKAAPVGFYAGRKAGEIAGRGARKIFRKGKAAAKEAIDEVTAAGKKGAREAAPPPARGAQADAEKAYSDRLNKAYHAAQKAEGEAKAAAQRQYDEILAEGVPKAKPGLVDRVATGAKQVSDDLKAIADKGASRATGAAGSVWKGSRESAASVVEATGKAASDVKAAVSSVLEGATVKAREAYARLEKARQAIADAVPDSAAHKAATAEAEEAQQAFVAELVTREFEDVSNAYSAMKKGASESDQKLLERVFHGHGGLHDVINASLRSGKLSPEMERVVGELDRFIDTAKANGHTVKGTFSHTFNVRNHREAFKTFRARGEIRSPDFIVGRLGSPSGGKGPRGVPVTMLIRGEAVPVASDGVVFGRGSRVRIESVEKPAYDGAPYIVYASELPAGRNWRDFGREGIAAAKRGAGAAGTKLLEAAKKDPAKALGVVAAPGAAYAATQAEGGETAGAAAAGVGLLTFFLPRGGSKLLAKEASEALGFIAPAARMDLQSAFKMTQEANEGLLRRFAQKKTSHGLTDPKALLDAQYEFVQRAFVEQTGLDYSQIPDAVYDAMAAELRFRNAELIEADPELLRLASIGRFDVVKGGGQGVPGGPKAKLSVVGEGADEAAAFEPDFSGKGLPTFADLRKAEDAATEPKYSLLERMTEASKESPISPEKSLQNKRDRYDLASEALQDGDMPEEVYDLLMKRREVMVERLPSRPLPEGQFYGHVDVHFQRFKDAAEAKLGRPLNERELEMAESDFMWTGQLRQNELTRVDAALAKDTARSDAYKKAIDDAPEDRGGLMDELDDEAEADWRDRIEEVNAELKEEGFDDQGLGETADIDARIERLKEKHILDPKDEIFIRKELGQEPPEDLEEIVGTAADANARYYEGDADNIDELTADDIIKAIEDGETSLGTHELTPWEEYHIRQEFDSSPGDYQGRFEDYIQENEAARRIDEEYTVERDAERRGMRRERNEDGERINDGDPEVDGLPPEWALKNAGLQEVKVFDNAGVDNIFGKPTLSPKELRSMFALDELRQFAKAEGSELETVLEVDNDKLFFNGTAGGGAFHVQAEVYVPWNGDKGRPDVRLNILRVPEGSGFTREGVLSRITAAFEALGVPRILGLGAGVATLGAGARALLEPEAMGPELPPEVEAQLEEERAREEKVENTRARLGYLKTQSETLMNTAARALANRMGKERTVAAVPGVTSNMGIKSFLGSNASVREAYEEKRETLEMLQRDPMLLVDELTEGLAELQETAPELHGKMVAQTYKIVNYLQSKLPTTIGTSLARPKGSPPNDLALKQFALYYSAATDPSSVLGDLANNRARREQVDTLKEVWGEEVYAPLKAKIAGEMAEGRPTVNQRIRLDLLFDFGDALDTGMSSRLLAVAAENEAKAKQGGAGGPGGPEGGGGAPGKVPGRRTQPSVTGTSATGSLSLGAARPA